MLYNNKTFERKKLFEKNFLKFFLKFFFEKICNDFSPKARQKFEEEFL